MATDEPAVGVCFGVRVDFPYTEHETSLGIFSSCEGLGLEVVLEQREEGGNNSMVWQLPTRIKYSTIKLTRPIGPDSALLVEWFAGMVNGVTPTTAVITAMTAGGEPVAGWSLQGVIPVRWTGPSLTVDSPKVVTETLELAHHGIRPKAGGQ